MSMSGIQCEDGCVDTFNELKLGKTLRYIIYHITGISKDEQARGVEKKIRVEKTGPASLTYADFTAALPADEPRFGVVDFAYEIEGGQRNKILFVMWSPDAGLIQQKMLYSASKDTLKKAFVGLATELQATDASELDESAALAKVLH